MLFLRHASRGSLGLTGVGSAGLCFGSRPAPCRSPSPGALVCPRHLGRLSVLGILFTWPKAGAQESKTQAGKHDFSLHSCHTPQHLRGRRESYGSAWNPEVMNSLPTMRPGEESWSVLSQQEATTVFVTQSTRTHNMIPSRNYVVLLLHYNCWVVLCCKDYFMFLWFCGHLSFANMTLLGKTLVSVSRARVWRIAQD